MINFSLDRNGEGERSKPFNRENVAEDKEHQTVYTNDFDGAYHVEQDDETEDDRLKSKGP